MVQLKNMQDSISGVSIDEEMINLIMYQKGFEASSRMISTIDEMMDTILSMKR
jgi:flagellar hook-associated protein 1 FlgK